MIQAPSEPPSSTPFTTPLPIGPFPESLPAVAPAVEAELPGLWKVTWPLFISLSLSLSLIFTDAFFLSRISDEAAGAAGALNPLLGATVVLFSAVGQAGASAYWVRAVTRSSRQPTWRWSGSTSSLVFWSVPACSFCTRTCPVGSAYAAQAPNSAKRICACWAASNS